MIESILCAGSGPLLGAFDLVQIGELVIIGLAAGILGGLGGIGGGLVMIPAMFLVLGESRFGQGSFHLYKLASITTSIVLSLPAVLRHRRQNAIVPGMVAAIVPGAIVGVLAGVFASSFLGGLRTRLLTRIFGGFMVLIVAFRAYRDRLRRLGREPARESSPMPTRRWMLSTLIGLPSGLIAGTLGVAGGVWAVPAQNMLGMQLRYAIANSMFMIVFVALATAVSQSVAVSRMAGLSAADGWLLALFLSPGALAGGWIGAGLTHRLPTLWLRLAVDALLVLTGVRLLLA